MISDDDVYVVRKDESFNGLLFCGLVSIDSQMRLEIGNTERVRDGKTIFCYRTLVNKRIVYNKLQRYNKNKVVILFIIRFYINLYAFNIL